MINQLTADDFRRFFVYYNDEEHQREAIEELWRRMPVDLLRDDCLWVKTYRTPKTSFEFPGHINAEGINLIKQWEGLRTESYICPAGVWTIGYGSTGDHVYPGQVITEAEATALLMDDLVDLWTRQPFTAVYVTHNLAEAVRLGHAIVVLSRRPGQIRELGCAEIIVAPDNIVDPSACLHLIDRLGERGL